MGCQLGGGRAWGTVGGIPGGVVLGRILSPSFATVVTLHG